jgi:L-fuconolactonase
MTVMTIDAHQHIWDLDQVAYPWLTPAFGPLARTYLMGELEPQLAAAEVTATILVQAANSYEDTAYMFDQADRYPWVVAVVGWVPLLYPDVTGRAIERLAANPYLRGIRHLIHNEPDPRWLLQDRVVESLDLLARARLTFDVVATLPAHLECVAALGERVPNLRMVIDHLGGPLIGTGTSADHALWRQNLARTAQNPNVYAKISGLGTLCADPQGWSADDIRPYVEFALATFGPQRCLCGGDWPVCTLAGSYARTWANYRAALAGLSEGDQEAVFGRSACAFYGIPIPASGRTNP